MTVNAHKLFLAPDAICFYRDIQVDEKVADNLRDARDKVRASVASAVETWADYVESENFFVESASERNVRNRPRFRMQGSFSYHTHITPASMPPQQIDLDDGMFLPISYLSQEGTQKPSIVSKALFSLVDAALESLCKTEGWKLDKSKSSCTRVILSDKEHVDLALYSVPDHEFVALMAEQASVQKRIGIDFAESFDLNEEIYRRLGNSTMMLAHRTEGWKPSNPRLLENWFKLKIDTHGQQLRRVCRYLKAWRDYTPGAERLASIALMAIAVSAFDEDPAGFDESRDDLALIKVARYLPAKLSEKLANPVVPGQFLDQGWTDDERSHFCAAGAELQASLIEAVVDADNAESCIQVLRSQFGNRIPEIKAYVSQDALNLDYKAVNFRSTGSASLPEKTAFAEVVRKERIETGANRPYLRN